jgi:hypothetical protein
MRDIEEIDWEKVLLADELRASSSSLKKTVNLLMGIGSFFFRRSMPKVSVDSDAILCVKSMERGDYEAQWALTLDCIAGKKTYITIEFKRGLSFDPLTRLRGMVPAWRASNQKKSLIARLSATLVALYCLDVLHSFRDAKPGHVLFFAEMRPFENVLVQHYNAKNILTTTLQHGLFIDYGAKKTINRLNYEASCARQFLAWGEETGQLIQRFNPSVEVVVCGALQIQDQTEEADPPCVYVVLDADINRNENEILLDVGRRLGRALSLECVACLHPRNRTDWYDLRGYSPLPPRDEYSRKGFVLGHTTTQLLKLARQGKRVFKLKSLEPCNRMIPDAVTFSDFGELQSKINSGDYPFEWSYAHIAEIGRDAEQEYRRFFSSWS